MMMRRRLRVNLSLFIVAGSVGRGRTKVSLESSGMEEEDENEADDEEDDEEEEMDQDDDDDDDNNDDVVESDHGDDEDKGIGVTLMVEGVVPMNGRYTTGQAPNRIFFSKLKSPFITCLVVT